MALIDHSAEHYGVAEGLNARVRRRLKERVQNKAEFSRVMGKSPSWANQFFSGKIDLNGDLIETAAAFVNLTLRELVEAPEPPHRDHPPAPDRSSAAPPSTIARDMTGALARRRPEPVNNVHRGLINLVESLQTEQEVAEVAAVLDPVIGRILIRRHRRESGSPAKDESG